MDKEFQTSFVPKKPIIEKAAPARAGGGFSAAFNLIGLIVFIASILAAGATYFYRGSLVDRVEEYKTSLERARNAFEPSLITELQTLDKRMRAASDILDNHVVVSPIFKLVGRVTLPTVRYSDFSYEFNEENPKLVDVIMTGEAKGYNYIALQADLFKKEKFIKNPIFSDFTLDQQGNIDFALSFSVDKSLVLYEPFLEREASEGSEFDPNAAVLPAAPEPTPTQPASESNQIPS